MWSAIDNTFARQPLSFKVLSTVVLATIIGFADFLSGTELAFSVFYILPIALAAWYCGRTQGHILAVLAAAYWFAAALPVRDIYQAEWILYWNVTARLATFLGSSSF